MREEKVENMAHETTPASAKRQKRSTAAAAGGSPNPLSTPPSVGAPTMSDDMYMLMDEDEKTSVSMSGGRSGGRSDKEILRVVTDGDSYDDGYRSVTCLRLYACTRLNPVKKDTQHRMPQRLSQCCGSISRCLLPQADCCQAGLHRCESCNW